MKILIGNVRSRVTDCAGSDIVKIDTALMFQTKGYQYSKLYRLGRWDGYTHLFSKALRTFPTGLLHLVLKVVPNAEVIGYEKGTEVEVDPHILATKSLTGKYAYQKDTIEAMLREKRGILYQATNAGKTSVCAAFLAILRKKTLFLVDRKELMIQAYEEFTTETDLEIGRFGSGIDNKKFVTVGMVQTIARKIKSRDKETLAWLKTIDIVVVDEVHGASSKTFLSILEKCVNADYRFGMSGTPFSSDELANAKVMSQLGPEIVRIRNSDLIKTKVSSEPIVSLVRINQARAKAATQLARAESDSKQKAYTVAYTVGIVENETRNSLVVHSTRDLLSKGHTILILVKRIKHGNILKGMFSDSGIEVAFCHGESSDEERELEISSLRNGVSKVLILSKIGQTGLNIPSLSCGWYAGGGKSKTEVIQSMGRYLRNPSGGETEVLFFDFYDEDNDYLEKHSKIRESYYRDEGFTTTISDGIVTAPIKDIKKSRGRRRKKPKA